MKIPEYDQNVSLSPPGPAPSISGEQAAAPWLMLAKVGKETYDLGRVIQEKQNETYRVQDVSERTVRAEEETSDLLLDLEQERDPKTAVDKFRDGYADIKNRVMDGVDDYKVANALTQHLASREATHSTAVKHTAFKWTLENDQQDMMVSNDRWKKAATNNPGQVDYAAGMIRGRVEASVRAGTITPAVGKNFLDKEMKDLYSQVMSQMILNDPKTAPELIKPLLAKSGLDPNDQYAMEQRAEHARSSFETKAAKGDKVLWDANAARAKIRNRVAPLTVEEVARMYEASEVGPEQLDDLHQVIDSTKTRVNTENTQTSYRAMNDVLVNVYTGRMKAEVAANRIYANSSILPEHKAQAMSSLVSFGKSGDSIPPEMAKAQQILLTAVAPSFLSVFGGKAEEKEAAGEVLREMWTDYFNNKAKYLADPDALIKRAIEKTKVVALVSDVPQASAASLAELYKQYDYYVVKGKPSPNGLVPRSHWEAWFRQKNGAMPPWPK